ncbi:MAG TPA: hypothetical protein VFW33_02430, partial [Gemmataceae bacterium]|nr:hypothetical protein [Gemmataceae bacterium]
GPGLQRRRRRGRHRPGPLGQLNALLGNRIEPVHGPARAWDVRHSRADLTRARRDPGYESVVAFREGLRRTLEACRAQ